MSDKITPELIEKVSRLIEAGHSPAAIKLVIQEETGYKKTKSNEIYNEIIKGVSFDSDIFDFDLEEQDAANKPYFNKTSAKYIVYISALGRNIVVSEERHKRIVELYSDWDGEGATLNEVCRAIQWPRPVLTQYLKAFGITKDTLPITENELEKFDDEELTSRLHELRKFSLYQRFEKEDWTATRSDAQKWRAFQYKKVNPFQEVLNNWSPPTHTILEKSNKIGDKTLLIGCCDWHLGAFADKDETFRGLDLNTNKTAQRIIEYSERVVQDIKKEEVSQIVVLFAGDLLHSCGNKAGSTVKGTPLESDNKGSKMFKLALDVLTIFLDNISSLGINVHCLSANGNHEGELNASLMLCMEKLYKNSNVTFDISNKFINHTVINNSIVCYTHGAAAEIKAKLPRANKAQSYVQSLFLEAQKDYPKCNSRYLFCADLHHQATQEYNDFLYILMPSITGGDGYSDTLNLNSRACQQTFLFDSEGIKSTNNYYFGS